MINYANFIDQNLQLADSDLDRAIENFNEQFQTIYDIPRKYQEDFIRKYSKLLARNQKWEMLLKVAKISQFLAEENSNVEWILEAENYLGTSYLKLNFHSEAISVFDKAISFAMKHNLLESNLRLLINRGLVMHFTSKYNDAIKDFSTAITISQETGNKLAYIQSLLNIQNSYYALSDFTRMEKVSLEGLELAEKEFPEFITSFTNSLGVIYYHNSNFAESLKYYFKSLENIDTEGRKDWVCNILMNIGNANMMLGKHDEAEEYFEKALSLARENNFIPIEIMIRINYSENFLISDNLPRALDILKVAEVLAENHNLRNSQLEIMKQKADFFKRSGDYQSCCEVLEDLNDKQSELFTDNLQKEIAETQSRFDLQMEQMKVDLLKTKNDELIIKNNELIIAQEEIRELAQKNSIAAMAVTANHEINQPLTVIMGNLELLMSQDLNEKSYRYCERIKNASSNISLILDKFRSYDSFKIDDYSDETKFFVFDDDMKK
jgi:tetratricopeptide (TPR) repeat protein